ncbi:pyrroline-5-carboxylate reductase [Enterococcus sp. HY326]|uniref:pyrroline-5-carboxylate reductase n=1 Tax=Enterococcus sp. HY326 TaxID=2971265 RepID=UPI002240E302|nr:pyrroline-5-carboxylate reductase [Enterococcus sp. HY326]
MKIGFIGAGNMAQAIIHGLIHKKVVAPEELFISAGHFSSAEAVAEKTGVVALKKNTEVVDAADIIILAVKPNLLAKVLPKIASTLSPEKTLVSIAAGVSLASLAELLGNDSQPLIRVMPNVNVSVEAGVSAICSNQQVPATVLAAVKDLFGAVGGVYDIAEKDFSTFIGLAGSSPAYVYMFIDAISRAGVLNGMPKKLATEIAAKAVLGSAKRLLEGEESPWDLVDQVSSPGGTTVEGVVTLEKAGFIPAVIEGIDATIKKDQSMS